MWGICKGVVWIISGEWVFSERANRENGGTMVAVRATWTAAFMFAGGLGLHEWLGPYGNDPWTWSATVDVVRRNLGLFGTLWGAAYAAFYTRFASQWSYLAGVYNQIKVAEMRMASDDEEKQAPARFHLAQWKAGFLEDVEDLHLAMKPMYCSLVGVWGNDPDVRVAYEREVVGGLVRLDELVECAEKVLAAHREKYQRRYSSRSSSGAPVM